MSNSAVSKTPSDRFMVTTQEFIKFVIDMITDLRTRGLTQVSPDMLILVRSLITAYDKDVLIASFIECHEDWPKVGERDNEFILTTVPQTYRKIPFDVTILTLPLRIYLELRRQNSHLFKPGMTENQVEDLESKWGVTGQDIDVTWQYFEAMISIACNSIHTGRRPVYSGAEFTYQNPSHQGQINLEHYVKLFKVKLDRQ